MKVTDELRKERLEKQLKKLKLSDYAGAKLAKGIGACQQSIGI